MLHASRRVNVYARLDQKEVNQGIWLSVPEVSHLELCGEDGVTQVFKKLYWMMLSLCLSSIKSTAIAFLKCNVRVCLWACDKVGAPTAAPIDPRLGRLHWYALLLEDYSHLHVIPHTRNFTTNITANPFQKVFSVATLGEGWGEEEQEREQIEPVWKKNRIRWQNGLSWTPLSETQRAWTVWGAWRKRETDRNGTS